MLKVKDHEDILMITVEDMIKYHGRQFIAGVAMAYQLLVLAARKMPQEILPREDFSVVLGVDGPGIIDGIEMATRAKSRGRLSVDQQLAQPSAAPRAEDGKGGKYYFEISSCRQVLIASVKPELIPEEFLALAAKTHDGTITAGETIRLQQLKEEIAVHLLAMEPEDIFYYQLNSHRS